jgi:hypothetical protein
VRSGHAAGFDPFRRSGCAPPLFDRHPAIAILDVGSLDGGPSGTVSDLFLSNVTGVSCERMIERGAIDILRMPAEGDRGPKQEDRF